MPERELYREVAGWKAQGQCRGRSAPKGGLRPCKELGSASKENALRRPVRATGEPESTNGKTQPRGKMVCPRMSTLQGRH